MGADLGNLRPLATASDARSCREECVSAAWPDCCVLLPAGAGAAGFADTEIRIVEMPLRLDPARECARFGSGWLPVSSSDSSRSQKMSRDASNLASREPKGPNRSVSGPLVQVSG
jgi:hypothetical protein